MSSSRDGTGRPPPAAGAAGGRDVSFRPQRALACLGALLLVAHLQPNQQQQRQQRLEQRQAGLAAVSMEGESVMPLTSKRHLLQAAGAALVAIGGDGVGVKLPAWSQ